MSTGYEQRSLKSLLTISNDAGLRHFKKIDDFVQKNGCFDLKVALFVEKRKNKFAYEFKKNKFVFNI